MALVECKDCKHEVSKTAKVCPNCGVSKPAKRKMSLKQKAVLGLVAVGSMIILSPSQADRQKEIDQLQQKAKTLDALDFENRYITYKKLHDALPKDESIKAEYEKYKKYDDYATSCSITGIKQDKQSLNFKDSYDRDFVDKYFSQKWIDKKTFVYQNSYSGTNAFKVKQGFISKYKCTIAKDGLRIQRVLFKKI